MLMLLISSALALSLHEVDTGMACGRIVADLFTNGLDYIDEITLGKPHLDRNAYHHKLFADFLDYCIEQAPENILKPITFSFKYRSWVEFTKYLLIDENNYNTEEDLIITEKQKLLRDSIFESDRRTPQREREFKDWIRHERKLQAEEAKANKGDL